MPQPDLLRHRPSTDADAAELVVDPDVRGAPVTPYLYGKFCEHLGTNVYHGMEAQILFNPTFGAWHFRAADGCPDGGFGSETDPEAIRRAVEDGRRALAYPPEADADALLAAYRDGLAFGWLPAGEGVAVSPDTGPTGDRAQRIEVAAGATGGVRQRTRLPLHRVRTFEFRCRLRAADPTSLDIAIEDDDGIALASATIDAGGAWGTVEGTIHLPENVDDDAVYVASLATDGPANVVVERLLLYPADHVDHADPEVVALLRESGLPLLRWPGGNFVSGYDWRDGVGPVDERPTDPNPAWDGLEYNLFGTDEFVRFCRNVGCEPSICVNAGSATPADAAAWVEYCNGDPEGTAMGRLRTENGHPEPHDVTYWELGNELYGRWQVRWTTPGGYADRYGRFREAMLAVDPSIEITACGRETNADGAWNDRLLSTHGADVSALSEHVLAGGRVDADVDPDELFEAFMGYAAQLGEEFDDLHERMREAGVGDPALDVTELQLFASFEGEPGALSPETMPTPVTISEALYDATVRHECIRRGGFVRMLTHSATVNHGGGLRKEGERVRADPCHHGRSMGMAQAGEVPVGVELTCDAISTSRPFREIDPVDGVPALDAMATVGEDGEGLTLVVVNRASRDGPVSLAIDASAVGVGDAAEVTELSAPTMHARNTRDDPENVAPVTRHIAFEGGEATVDVPAYAMLLVRVALE